MRTAMRAIIVAMVVNVVVGGVLIRVLDPKEFADVGEGMWWALQTVTTVGYGDVTPTTVPGRLVAAAVMLFSLAFLTVVTAAVTTTFVERARARHDQQENAAQTHDAREMAARLDEIVARLALIEAAMKERRASNDGL